MVVRFESLYISLPSYAKQREMTKLYVFWKTITAMVNFFEGKI